jgi:quinolinate synthase
VKPFNLKLRIQETERLKDSSFNIEEAILNLKKEKNAIILGHYYQNSEIQDISDLICDSYELAKKAKAASSEIILFAGVTFMAETAKILNPSKNVNLKPYAAYSR